MTRSFKNLLPAQVFNEIETMKLLEVTFFHSSCYLSQLNPRILPSSNQQFRLFYSANQINNLLFLQPKSIMDLRFIDAPFLSALHHHMMDMSDEAEKYTTTSNAPTRSYYRDAKAMAATPADVKEYPNSYSFVIDMPGLKSGDIKVQLEEDNVLVISGERKREEEKEGSAKYVRMERRVGKFMRKFVLPENADAEAISAVCQDGVLTVKVDKMPPPQAKKPKTIHVNIA